MLDIESAIYSVKVENKRVAYLDGSSRYNHMFHSESILGIFIFHFFTVNHFGHLINSVTILVRAATSSTLRNRGWYWEVGA